jgi:hypothetical protein
VQEVRYFSPPIARVFPVGLESQMLETSLFEVAASRSYTYSPNEGNCHNSGCGSRNPHGAGADWR